MAWKGWGIREQQRTLTLLVLEVDLPPQLVLLVAELGGDGLAFLERLSDAALLLELHTVGALEALGVQVLPPRPLGPPYHPRSPPLLSRANGAGKTLGV